MYLSYYCHRIVARQPIEPVYMCIVQVLQEYFVMTSRYVLILKLLFVQTSCVIAIGKRTRAKL